MNRRTLGWGRRIRRRANDILNFYKSLVKYLLYALKNVFDIEERLLEMDKLLLNCCCLRYFRSWFCFERYRLEEFCQLSIYFVEFIPIII